MIIERARGQEVRYGCSKRTVLAVLPNQVVEQTEQDIYSKSLSRRWKW